MNDHRDTRESRDFNTAVGEVRALRMTAEERAKIQTEILKAAPANTGAEKIPAMLTP